MKKITAFLTIFILVSSFVYAQNISDESLQQVLQNAPQETIVDSALVRIRVDIPESKIYLDNQLVENDSYGSAFSPYAWFILNLPVGQYHFYIFNNLYIPVDTVVTLVSEVVSSIDVKYLVTTEIAKAFYAKPVGIETVLLNIKSSPDSAVIFLNNDSLEVHTPTELYLQIGVNRFEVKKEGYEPLGYSIDLAMSKQITTIFNLKQLEPVQLTAESMELVYMTKQPMLNPLSADKIKKKYNSMAETFFIFPFFQGLVAKLIVNESQQGSANVLLISGAILSAGSYLMGKILSNKRLNFVNSENERRAMDNLLVDDNNLANDQAVREKNEKIYRQWQVENSDKGVVRVHSDSTSN